MSIFTRPDEQDRKHFDYLWRGLAEKGYVDALGGAEYRRARSTYCVDNWDMPIGQFLLKWITENFGSPAECVKSALLPEI